MKKSFKIILNICLLILVILLALDYVDYAIIFMGSIFVLSFLIGLVKIIEAILNM